MEVRHDYCYHHLSEADKTNFRHAAAGEGKQQTKLNRLRQHVCARLLDEVITMQTTKAEAKKVKMILNDREYRSLLLFRTLTPGQRKCFLALESRISKVHPKADDLHLMKP